MVVGEGINPPGPDPVALRDHRRADDILAGHHVGRLAVQPVRQAIRKCPALALLVGAYVLTWVGFRLFFNYDFLQGAPPEVNLASAPHGLFNGVVALVFYVTALAAMFLVLCFDLWPLTTTPSVMQQPALGITWSILCVADRLDCDLRRRDRRWAPTRWCS